MDNITIRATRGQSRDIDSQYLTVTFRSNDHIKTVEGHINHRTNMVHLSADDNKQEKELIHWGIDLDEVSIQIEDREIELN